MSNGRKSRSLHREVWKRSLKGPQDPSLLSQLQLAKRTDPLNTPWLVEALLEAQRKAPNASPATQRKWRKVLGLG